MKGIRKDLTQEAKLLKERLRTLVHNSMSEARRTATLLREAERAVEDRFVLLDSLESAREKASRKFRKNCDGNGNGFQ